MTESEDEDRISTKDAARLCGWAQETMRVKIRQGVFREGVHWWKPEHSNYRWSRAALRDWLNKTFAPHVIRPLRRG